jgi:pilus assembly protein CpaB
MNKNILIVMGGALVVAIIVAMLVQMKLSSKPQKGTSEISGTEVLVANKTMGAGEKLNAADVRWQALPDAAIFNGLIRRKEQADENKLEVYNKILRRDIMSGEPVTAQALIMSASGSFLSAILAPGMRAVAVPVRAETSAGGFVSTGDYVDVLLTYQVNMRGEAENYTAGTVQRFASETVMSNVHVLAVDQNAKEGNRDARVARTVTLEVSKEGAQILAVAASMGALSLSLRHIGEKDTAADNNTPLTTDITTSRIMKKIYKEMGNSNTVRLYNGNSVVNVPVRAAPKP